MVCTHYLVAYQSIYPDVRIQAILCRAVDVLTVTRQAKLLKVEYLQSRVPRRLMEHMRFVP